MTQACEIVFLGTRTLISPHGEFDVSIDGVAISEDGLVIQVTWSVRHLDKSSTESFPLQWCDPLLVHSKYDCQTKTYDQKFFVDALLETLDAEREPGTDNTLIVLIEDGFDICSQGIRWDEVYQQFV